MSPRKVTTHLLAQAAAEPLRAPADGDVACPVCSRPGLVALSFPLRKTSASWLLLIAGLTLAGCGHKAPRIFAPPYVAARVPSTAAPLDTEPLQQPPQLVVLSPQQAPEVTTTLSRVSLPPPPQPPKPPVRPVAPEPTAPVVVPRPPDAPRLAQIFTPAQEAAYKRDLDDSLDRIRKAVASLAGRRLNAAQQETLNNIRTFQRQAEQAREQDLVTAVNLAKRADLLAKDLLERLP